MRFLSLLALLAALPALPAEFLVKPYLQLGDTGKMEAKESMTLLWHTSDRDEPWVVRFQTGSSPWTRVAAAHTVVRLGSDVHRVYRAILTPLKPGKEFGYEVMAGDRTLFSARARARRSAHEPQRFVVFGDCGAGTAGQKAIAYQAWQARPDYVFITGDIVYGSGRVSEYRERYFPIYNADVAAVTGGAPLLRSVLFLAAPGNHDFAARDLARFPDGMAYYAYWDQPLNGPLTTRGAPNTPAITGPDRVQRDFLAAAGPAYPRMANFSFDYGNVHWTVLDTNPYVDWTDAKLRSWLEDDLQGAQKAAWRMVGFHHPPFSSSRAHFNDQWPRVLAPIFERYGVSLVFAGHVHNYQRSYPLTFVPKPAKDGKVPGTWTLDREYDGVGRTRPRGVIYVVTGAGGARLYDPQQNDPKTWQEFTTRFVADRHSFTVVEADKKKISVRQVDELGAEVDRFVIGR